MILYNPHQPSRPTHLDDGQALNYRTHVSHQSSTYDVYNELNMTAQAILYRWSRSEDFVRFVSIDELHKFLFWKWPDITKRQMGRAIVQAISYDPRKLKGVTKNNPKAKMCYLIQYPEELQYGLEWMISMWIWRLETNKPTPETTLEFLDDLASLPVAQAVDVWIDPLYKLTSWVKPPEPLDWETIWDKHEMEEQGLRRAAPSSQPPPLQSQE